MRNWNPETQAAWRRAEAQREVQKRADEGARGPDGLHDRGECDTCDQIRRLEIANWHNGNNTAH